MVVVVVVVVVVVLCSVDGTRMMNGTGEMVRRVLSLFGLNANVQAVLELRRPFGEIETGEIIVQAEKKKWREGETGEGGKGVAKFNEHYQPAERAGGQNPDPASIEKDPA